jgi:hypothetical protein
MWLFADLLHVTVERLGGRLVLHTGKNLHVIGKNTAICGGSHSQAMVFYPDSKQTMTCTINSRMTFYVVLAA